MSTIAESQVKGIVNALSALEDDIDSLHASVSDIQKNIHSKTQVELDALMEKTKQIALQEAESIINVAKSNAEAQATKIQQESKSTLAQTQSNIDANFDQAIEIVVSNVLKA